MAIVPHKFDKNRKQVIDRMHDMAKGPDGREKIKAEFGIDLGEGKGSLPRKESSVSEQSEPSTAKSGK